MPFKVKIDTNILFFYNLIKKESCNKSYSGKLLYLSIQTVICYLISLIAQLPIRNISLYGHGIGILIEEFSTNV